jgi:hypothetical protein
MGKKVDSQLTKDDSNDKQHPSRTNHQLLKAQKRKKVISRRPHIYYDFRIGKIDNSAVLSSSKMKKLRLGKNSHKNWGLLSKLSVVSNRFPKNLIS